MKKRRKKNWKKERKKESENKEVILTRRLLVPYSILCSATEVNGLLLVNSILTEHIILLALC